MLNNINIKNNIINKIKEKITKQEQETKIIYEKMIKRNLVFYLSASFILFLSATFISKQHYSQDLEKPFITFLFIEVFLFLSTCLFLRFKEEKMNKKLFSQELCLMNFLKRNNITFNKEEKECFLEYLKYKNISSNSNIFDFLKIFEENNEKEKIKSLKSIHIDKQYDFLEAK